MKKVAEFIEGTFIDYKGDKREYTICALSCPIEEGDDKASDSEVKQLRLGIAVRRDGERYFYELELEEKRQKMSKKMQDIHDYLLIAPDWELEILIECLMYDAELQRKGKL